MLYSDTIRSLYSGILRRSFTGLFKDDIVFFHEYIDLTITLVVYIDVVIRVIDVLVFQKTESLIIRYIVIGLEFRFECIDIGIFIVIGGIEVYISKRIILFTE